jgi:hypothetical protein
LLYEQGKGWVGDTVSGAEVAYAKGLVFLSLQEVIDFAKLRVCIAMGYDGMIG